MKSTFVRKKRPSAVPKVNATLQIFNYLPVLQQRCPSCDDLLTAWTAPDGVKFISTPTVCKECGTAVMYLQPPEIDQKIATPEAAPDTEQTPIMGADVPSDRAETFKHFQEAAGLSLPSREVPMFGTTEKEIDAVVDKLPGDPPKFPFWRSAFTGAAIAVSFVALMVLLAVLWHIQLPIQKPTPAVQPTSQQGWTSMAICPPNKTCAVTATTESSALSMATPTNFGFELTMNEDAWMQVEVDGRESISGYVLKKGANHIWFDVSQVKVRCGKPGAVTYLVNGRKISPKNAAEKPDKVEVVTLTAGVTLGNEAYPKE